MHALSKPLCCSHGSRRYRDCVPAHAHTHHALSTHSIHCSCASRRAWGCRLCSSAAPTRARARSPASASAARCRQVAFVQQTGTCLQCCKLLKKAYSPTPPAWCCPDCCNHALASCNHRRCRSPSTPATTCATSCWLTRLTAPMQFTHTHTPHTLNTHSTHTQVVSFPQYTSHQLRDLLLAHAPGDADRGLYSRFLDSLLLASTAKVCKPCNNVCHALFKPPMFTCTHNVFKPPPSVNPAICTPPPPRCPSACLTSRPPLRSFGPHTPSLWAPRCACPCDVLRMFRMGGCVVSHAAGRACSCKPVTAMI